MGAPVLGIRALGRGPAWLRHSSPRCGHHTLSPPCLFLTRTLVPGLRADPVVTQRDRTSRPVPRSHVRRPCSGVGRMPRFRGRAFRAGVHPAPGSPKHPSHREAACLGGSHQAHDLKDTCFAPFHLALPSPPADTCPAGPLWDKVPQEEGTPGTRPWGSHLDPQRGHRELRSSEISKVPRTVNVLDSAARAVGAHAAAAGQSVQGEPVCTRAQPAGPASAGSEGQASPPFQK